MRSTVVKIKTDLLKRGRMMGSEVVNVYSGFQFDLVV